MLIFVLPFNRTLYIIEVNTDVEMTSMFSNGSISSSFLLIQVHDIREAFSLQCPAE